MDFLKQKFNALKFPFKYMKTNKQTYNLIKPNVVYKEFEWKVLFIFFY